MCCVASGVVVSVGEQSNLTGLFDRFLTEFEVNTKKCIALRDNFTKFLTLLALDVEKSVFSISKSKKGAAPWA